MCIFKLLLTFFKTPFFGCLNSDLVLWSSWSFILVCFPNCLSLKLFLLWNIELWLQSFFYEKYNCYYKASTMKYRIITTTSFPAGHQSLPIEGLYTWLLSKFLHLVLWSLIHYFPQHIFPSTRTPSGLLWHTLKVSEASVHCWEYLLHSHYT